MPRILHGHKDFLKLTESTLSATRVILKKIANTSIHIKHIEHICTHRAHLYTPNTFVHIEHIYLYTSNTFICTHRTQKSPLTTSMQALSHKHHDSSTIEKSFFLHLDMFICQNKSKYNHKIFSGT